MADQLKAQLDLSHVELISGDRGEFSIWVDTTCVARKTFQGYPAPQAVIDAVREQLA